MQWQQPSMVEQEILSLYLVTNWWFGSSIFELKIQFLPLMPGYGFKRLTIISSNNDVSYSIQEKLKTLLQNNNLDRWVFLFFFLKPHKTWHLKLFQTLLYRIAFHTDLRKMQSHHCHIIWHFTNPELKWCNRSHEWYVKYYKIRFCF